MKSCLTLLLLCGAFVQSAFAYSRAYLPLPKAVAAADAIAVVQPVKVLASRKPNVGESVQLEVVNVLKGKIKKGTLWVRLHRDHKLAFGRLTTDKKWVFFLSACKDGPPAHEAMLDGTTRYDAAIVSKISSIVEQKQAAKTN